MSPWKWKHFVASVFALGLEYSLKNYMTHAIVVSKSDRNYLTKFFPQQHVSAVPIATEYKVLTRTQTKFVHSQTKVLIWVDLSVEHLRLSFLRLADFLRQNSKIISGFEFHVLCRKIHLDHMESEELNNFFHFVDWVPDLDEYLSSFDIAVLPDLVGTGLKNRLVDCVRNGLSVIATPAVLEGFSFKDKNDLLVYTEMNELESSLLLIRDDHDLRQKLSANATKTLLKDHGFENVKLEWRYVLEKVIH
jgi:hypothetical protein